MTPDEIHMYLGSIADSIHNFLVDACRGSATLTRRAIDAANKSFSSWMILSNELVRILPTVGLIEEKGSTALNTVNDSHKRREEEMCIVYLLEARNLLFQMAWRIASTGIAHCHGKQKAPTDPNDQSCIRIHDFNHLREVLSLPMPLVNVPESFQKVDVFFRFMDAALRLRRLPTPPSNSAWTEIEVRRRGREMVVLVPSSMESTVVDENICLYSLILSFATKHGLYVPVLDEQPSLTCLQCRIPPPALIVHFFDARHWGFDSSTCFLITQIRAAACCASSSTRTTATPQTQSSSDAEELPFPADLAAALVDYTHEYKQEQHHERQLHWCRDYAYTTFVMYYPRDGGLPTTIHGTLHLQRLFVALTGYKRVGVTWSHLAARAHVSVEELKEQLHKCVEFGLLVSIGKNDNEGNGVEHVAMNYDYVRPVESTEFVIVLWPKFPRPLKEILGGAKKFPDSETISGANCVEKLAPVVMSIMKQRKKIPYPELVDLVRAAVETRFVPTPPMMKSCVEGLIDRNYLMRTVEEGSTHLVSSAVILEYMP